MVAAAMKTMLASGRVPGRAGRGLQALLGGMWLGLLSEPQLRELDERYYRLDETYRREEWNRRGLAVWEREVIERAFRPGARLAVPACGGGREVLALLRDGYDATGFESHPELVSFARAFLARAGFPGRALPCARDAFPPGGHWDGVLVGWGAYSLIVPRARRIAFLRDAAASCRQREGAVVVSCFWLPSPTRRLRLTASLAGALRLARRTGPVELGDTLAPNLVHVFSPDELRAELQQAGLVAEALGEALPAGADPGYLWAIGRSPGAP